jgi:peptide/nickel transport system substrate-binding protein
MNKEPLGLYIFRFIMGLGLFIFMVMLYWSSLLIEENLKGLRSDVESLKKDIFSLRNQGIKLNSPTANNQNSNAGNQTTDRPLIDSTLPNLLEEDPFYTTTLPNILGAEFKPHGTFHSAVLGKPQNLHPFSNWSNISTWISQCSVSVSKSKFGIYETFAPDMAIKVEERTNKETGKREYWIHLRDNVYWQPLSKKWFPDDFNLSEHFLTKHQVTAEDFKFFFDAITNPYMQEPGAVALRTIYEDMEGITVVDPLTFIVTWRGEPVKDAEGKFIYKPKYVAKLLTGGLRPLAGFVYKYFADGSKILDDDTATDTYAKNSVWAQNFAQHWAKNIIVSCGGWIFDGMTDRQISFKRNPDHYFPLEVLAENMEVQFKDSPDAMWQEFKNNKIDTYEIRPDQILELKNFLSSPQYANQVQNQAAIKQIEFVARMYSYIGWNEAKPFFKSKEVRQALTMAIDRKRIIQQNLNGLGIETNGTFYRFSPSYNESIQPWPYDVQKAKSLLEKEGWYDHDGDGIIDKVIDGKSTPFHFRLTYYVKNSNSKAVVEYVAIALKDVGIDCELNGVDTADLTAVFEEKNFDALNLAWLLGTPPEDLKQLWYSAGATQQGSSNAIGFSNKEADRIIDELQYESDQKKRLELYHQFSQIIHEEAPYTFLYVPKSIMLYREYVKNVFIPAERQDLVPGANVAQPDSTIFYLEERK